MAGLALSLTGYVLVREVSLAQFEAPLRDDTTELAEGIQEDFARGLDDIAHVGAFVSAAGPMALDRLETFTARVLPHDRAVRGLVWAQRIARPESTAGAAYPVRWAVPVAADGSLLGRDLMRTPALARLILRLLESGEAMAVSADPTIPGNRDQGILTVVHLVRRDGGAVEGVVVATISVADLADASLRSQYKARELDLYIYDDAAQADRRLLYFRPAPRHAGHDHGAAGAHPLPEAEARDGLGYTAALNFVGRGLSLVARPAHHEGIAAVERSAWWALGLGLLGTSLLIAYLSVLSSHRRAHEQTERLTERLGRIIDGSFNEVYIFDSESCRFLRVSRGALDNLGYDEDDVAALRPWDLMADMDAEAFAVAVAPLRRGEKETLVFQTAHIRKDGTRYPVEVRLQLSHLESPPVFVAIAADISERKAADEAMQAAIREAECANLAKSEFLANMSHELRTPLNAIIGFAEVIQKETFGPLANPKYSEYLEDIHHSGKLLLALINDVLDLSKIEAGQLKLNAEAIDVSETIQAARGMIAERARQGGLTVEIDLDPAGLPALYADRRMVLQVLTNLLSNAVKFTPPGGRITAKAWQSPGSGFVVQVVDTGIGIALEDIPKALARFGQVDSGLQRRHEGTGLGLPLTRSMVEMHGGSLDLQSELGVGTTVTVRFPAERVIGLAPGTAQAV